ncbi:Peptidase A1 [Macleaya cordata]|uniref:Peptidase A1 n=1 Tax=Macleaya cordata TaxID=56857 RepID=A0A200Q4U4_MACCD|nr:Peptidase A1 [Macleaya cordata]
MTQHDQNLISTLSIIFFFTLALIISPTSTILVSAQPYKGLVSPITKDPTTSLYSLTLNFHEKYVIDIGGPFLWYHCPKKYLTVSCYSPECLNATSYFSPLCPTFVGEGRNQCTCVVTPVNPVTNKCFLAELTHKDLIISWTDGEVPKVGINFNQLYVSCAPQILMKSLPLGVSGMAGLSRSLVSVSTQFLSPNLEIKRQFSICLPSTGSVPGVIFFGEGPFYMMPPTKSDVRTILSYTPLIQHPTSPDYYINLKGVSINGKFIRFLARVLDFDSDGNGGVKLSTVVPYTTLRTHIYKPFLKDFIKATNKIPRAEKVKPFDYCLNTTNLGSTRVGLPVPQIDLVLGNGKNWTIFGANSMKQVSNDVACLAFVDGGKKAEQAMVIGSFQMEDNFLLFDLEESRLGFSSSLYFMRTTCGNFNFKGGV